jgi:hypothetical protein
MQHPIVRLGGSGLEREDNDENVQFIPCSVQILSEANRHRHWNAKGEAIRVRFVAAAHPPGVEGLCFTDLCLKSMCIPNDVDFIARSVPFLAIPEEC